MRKEQNPTATYKTRLFFLVATVSLILIAGAYLFFSYEENSIRAEKHNELKAIAKLKISQITNWNKERLSDIKVISKSPFFIYGLEKWLSSKSNFTYREEILKRIALINADSIYSNIIITDVKGELLLSLKSNPAQLDLHTTAFVKKAVIEKRLLDTDLYKCQPRNEIQMDYIAPVINKNNLVIAVIILRIDPNTYLYPLLNEWPTPSKTSETLIVRKEEDSVIYLNELANRKNTALKLTIPLKHKEVPAVQAALGCTGIFEGKSYYQTNVLSFISPIPGMQWIMIAQVNESEIYAGLYFREIVIISFTILLIIVLSVGLIWYYHYRQRNIYKELFVKEQELREYHEEFRTILYSIGDGVITTDVNCCIKQMNLTAEILTGWTEAEAIGKPIDHVFNVIDEETKNKIENPVHRVLKEGVIIGLANHTLLISRDGKETPIADSGAPIRDTTGAIEGVVLVFRDKSEEHTSEMLLRRSEERLKRAELTSKSGNWELHLDTKIVFASVGAAKIYGVTKDKFTYESIKNFPLLEYRPILDTALYNLISYNHPYDVEFKIKAEDTGEIKYIHSIAEYDKDNNILFGVIQDISTQKILEQSRFQLVHIIEKSLNEIYVFDSVSLKFEYVNESALNNLGYTFNEISELTPVDIKPEYTLDSFRQYVEPLLTGQNEKLVFETTHRRKNGSEYPVEVHLQLHSLENKRVFFAVISDITQRNIIHQELLHSKQILQNIIDNTPSLIYLLDTNGKFLLANKQLEAVLNITEERLIGNTRQICMPDEIAEQHRENDLFVINSKQMISVEEENIEHDGKHFYLTQKFPLIDSKGNVYAVGGISTDITLRRKNEESLESSVNKWQSTFDGIKDAIFLLDTNGIILQMNKGSEIMFEKKAEEFVGNICHEVIHNCNFHIDGCPFIRMKQSYKRETMLLPLDNKWMEVTVDPILDENKNLIGAVHIVQDVTERKRIETELEIHRKHLEELVKTRTAELDQLNSELVAQLQKEKEVELILKESLSKEKDLNELKTRFISITSHEFRTPLTSILSSAQLIQRYMLKWDDTKKNEHLERVIHSVEYLKKMLDDVLTISRTESGTISYNPELFDLKEFVVDLVEEMKNHSKNHNFTLKYNSVETKFLLDKKLVRFILSNLLSNAIKYSPDGGMVEFNISSKEGFLKLEVIDQGIGIPDDDIGRVFESFYRSKNAENYSGTGLGLAIVKSAVELHSGSIKVQSELGKGTTFEVRLPIKL